MKKRMSLILLFPLFLLLSGCYTPQAFQAKSQGIRRIALAEPSGQKEGLYAMIQPSLVISPNSFLGGLEAEGVAKSKTFNDLVLKKFPKGVVYNDFLAEVKRGLELKGFQVVDTTNRPSAFAITLDPLGSVNVPLVSQEEADIILVPATNFGYFATSALAFYHRNSWGKFALIDTRTKKVIFIEPIPYNAPDSNFEYATYEKLTADMVPPVEALRDVAKVVGAHVAAAIQ